jgi:hypothetical protein
MTNAGVPTVLFHWDSEMKRSGALGQPDQRRRRAPVWHN